MVYEQSHYVIAHFICCQHGHNAKVNIHAPKEQPRNSFFQSRTLFFSVLA